MEYVVGLKYSDPPLSEEQKAMVAAAVREYYRQIEKENGFAPFTLHPYKNEPVKVFSSQSEWVAAQARESLHNIMRH